VFAQPACDHGSFHTYSPVSEAAIPPFLSTGPAALDRGICIAAVHGSPLCDQYIYSTVDRMDRRITDPSRVVLSYRVYKGVTVASRTLTLASGHHHIQRPGDVTYRGVIAVFWAPKSPLTFKIDDDYYLEVRILTINLAINR